jgi:translocon-associated protein subunit beta
MNFVKILLGLTLMGGFLLVAGELEAGGARILAVKNIVNLYLVENKDLTVEYSLYNVGDSAALDVSLVDSTFPADDFEVVHGKLDVKWERIAPGANVTHAAVLKPLKSGYFNFTSAEIG